MSKKIIFMGTPDFSVPILKSLYNSNIKIETVYTQPPKKKLRGQKIIKSPVHIESDKLGIPVRHPEKLNNEEDFNFIKTSGIKYVVVVAYGQIIPKKILNISEMLFLNIHASLLPRWRGAAPIQRAIIEMDSFTGISIMKVEPKLDTGPYMMQEKIKLEGNENFNVLSKKLSILGSKLILESLEKLEKKKAKFVYQDDSRATYAKKIEKKESEVNWNISAKNLIAKINGLNPIPGVWFKHLNTRLKIIEAVEVSQSGKIGEVLDNYLTIACKDKAIKILMIQKEGKNALNAKSFLAGYKIKKGEIVN
ncbi:methionyl-tRNA formyltransferase [Pelagibacteraceae bacterium]|jgi:methionyl-tRNA formyltransferase|nr:methionyl-tRNA formyltransferase [Pelagibacteraceae bacterium]MDC1158831.1 methionyl-tRNA formyltransferase [Pelagibacteraceae bacterium]